MNSNINRVAMALLIDYSSVYYIDLKTNHYECYSTNQGYKNLKIQSSGDDFFMDCQRDIRAVVYADDWDRLSAALEREALLQQFHDKEAISLVYRLMIDGQPVYHTMRILHDASGDEDILILGVLNVDDQVRSEQATKTYNAIAKTLANRYASIYYIDLENNHYVEYSSSDDYKDLEVPPEGDDFFAASAKNVLRYIHEEDQERVLRIFRKNILLSLTEGNMSYQTEYRLMMNGEAHHVRLMAVRTENGRNLIVALTNIDAEVRQQEELRSITEKNVVFNHIAETLARQYGMIYYIDTETDDYIEFTATDEYKSFNISPFGTDFFGSSQRNVSIIAHPADREKLFDALDKQTMLGHLRKDGSFTLTYRLMLDSGNGYTRMSVLWANDKKHIIMAVQNIDNEIQKEAAVKRMAEQNAVFSQIAESLAAQYDTIYYVNMLTDSYMEFSSTDVYKSLEVKPSGDDFFAESVRNIERVIHPDDREGVLRILNKPTMLQMLQGQHMVTHTYRLMLGEDVMYARLSIIWATDNKHLILGVMNIDSEVRREQAVQAQLLVANEKAFRDELTGVKNKAAYKEAEKKMDETVRRGDAKDFSIVVCDVNGLKSVNDRLGHIQGDALIRNASKLICHIWAHSPVFRIGGDEFAVLLQGDDYEARYELLEKLRIQIRRNQRDKRVVVAVGMADFLPGIDASMANVFDRADAQMYEDKIVLKTMQEIH